MDRLIVLQFVLLLFAVPFQLFLLSNWRDKNTEQVQTIYQITNYINEIFRYLSPNIWLKSFISLAIDIPVSFDPLLHKRTWQRDSESPAVEVYHIREKYGYFATSPKIRSPRSKHVQFRIGQVIRHKIYGYRAVIIGWDETARASKQWLQEYSKYAKQPNYSVLLDTRDRRAHKTYIPQEHIEVITNTKILNAQLTDYFTLFDGSRYMVKPWLREEYPHG